MIYTSGLVTILDKSDKPFTIQRNKRKFITLKKADNTLNEEGKVSYRFTAILPRSYECYSLEDYTGKIKPFLQDAIGRVIVSVHVTHLNYLSKQAITKLYEKR